MKLSRKATNKAQELLETTGFEHLIDYSLEDFVFGIGATYIEEPLRNSDGRIVFGKNRALIKINSEISYEGRKRFAIAHEIGHFVMHKDLEMHNENSNTLSFFDESKFKKGLQEKEANDFASELLMPSSLFLEKAQYKPFNPELLKSLATYFKTSITSISFKYLNFPLHPIFLCFISNGKVIYWKKSNDLDVWVKDLNGLPPPDDSVAYEYVENDYNYIYGDNDQVQDIDKSTWFKLRRNEEDCDFYEYCIVIKSYKTILSLVWED